MATVRHGGKALKPIETESLSHFQYVSLPSCIQLLDLITGLVPTLPSLGALEHFPRRKPEQESDKGILMGGAQQYPAAHSCLAGARSGGDMASGEPHLIPRKGG